MVEMRADEPGSQIREKMVRTQVQYSRLIFDAFSAAKFRCFRAWLQDLICSKVPIYGQRPAFGRECFWGAFFSILRSQPNYLTEGGNFWRFQRKVPTFGQVDSLSILCKYRHVARQKLPDRHNLH